jgi:hypothetical protein
VFNELRALEFQNNNVSYGTGTGTSRALINQAHFSKIIPGRDIAQSYNLARALRIYFDLSRKYLKRGIACFTFK